MCRPGGHWKDAARRPHRLQLQIRGMRRSGSLEAWTQQRACAGSGGLGLGPSAAAVKTGCCRPWAAPRGVPCAQQSCFPRLGFAAACRCTSAPRVGGSGPGQEAPDGERPGPSTQGPSVPPPACCQRPRCHHGGRTCEVSGPVTDTGVRLGSSQRCGQSWCAASGCQGPPCAGAQQRSPAAACSRLQRCWAHPDAAVTTV